MKKNCLIAFCVFGYGALMAQSIERDVTASAGDNFSNATASLSWTLGECVTGYLSGNEINVSQGFQQVYSTNSPLDVTNPLVTGIMVYPNPAGKILKVEITSTDSKTVAELTDLNGRLLLKKPLHDVLTELPIEHLSIGIYLLNIKSEKGNIITYKIEKN